MADRRRVVITGLGIICPVGNDLKTAWDNLVHGRSGVAKIQCFDASAYSSQIAGEVKGLVAENYMAPSEVKRYDRFSLIALAACKEAWNHAGISAGDYRPERMGVILGVGIGGLSTLEENHEALLKGGPRKVSPFLIPKMISNLAPGNLAIAHGLQGVNYTITSACTSGTHALGEAFRMIRDGLQDVIVTGGAEAAITPLAVAGFGRMKALSTRNDAPEKASRPFDRDRDGFVIGEGAGVLVLEDYESAKKRGAQILAEVVGYGFSCDAFHITSPSEDGLGAKLCMRGALASAQVAPDKIQYINAHGTSTPFNDMTETMAIKEVFGQHAKAGLVVNSTKSMTGHLLGAAGGIEAIFLAMSLKTSVVPPTINLENPDEGCDLDYVPNVAREMSVELGMSNSFGFGGTNASIVLKRV